jgi:hypothetical protein
MAGYTKLFDNILNSTIWQESDKTVRVWIAMLAVKNADGFVEGSIPGFAYRAKVTTAEMEEAVRILSSPDPYSSNPANEGRRIVPVDGGWVVLNHKEWRDRLQQQQGSRAVDMVRYRKKRNGLHQGVTGYIKA